MRKLKLSNTEELRCLLKENISDNHSRFLHRLHCVVLVSLGFSCYQIAKWFELNPRTIERWVHSAQEYGIEGLKDEQKTGRPAKIRDDQYEQLQSLISHSPRDLGYSQDSWNGRLLSQHIERFYDIELSVRQCQRLLIQLQVASSPVS